jgi:hypothetical protein
VAADRRWQDLLGEPENVRQRRVRVTGPPQEIAEHLELGEVHGNMIPESGIMYMILVLDASEPVGD